ncbi:hypothetical protein AAEU32_06775 [Pseudoalteromonas sp. SSDWG2]|uniref:hypothetical protein n=1 Tax=Pseudoalteromonas sp. SSDWG2 TaxID=3139391 RepID=UPI003BAA27BB
MANTHTTKFKALVYRLGSQPKLSLKRFFIGIGLFAVAVALIYIGYRYEPLWQIPGLVVLAPALFFAIWGYIGIFANRFAQVISVTDGPLPADDNELPK